jgi:hypothetical protein
MRLLTQDRIPGRPWAFSPRACPVGLRAVPGIARNAGGTPAIRIILCALVLAMALAACGKRNAPEPPPGVPDTYPRPYPSE